MEKRTYLKKLKLTQKKSINIIIFNILILLINIALIKSSFGFECGDLFYQKDNINTDLICNSSIAIKLTSNTIINCNNHSIIGNGNNIGIEINGRSNVEIINCKFYNFSKGIKLTTYKKIDSNGWGAIKYKTIYPNNIKIHKNYFENNSIGIYSDKSKKEIIWNNTFYNNYLFGIYSASLSTKIYNNDFYNTSIFYTQTNGKYFCNDGIGNKYHNILGPTCNCIIPYSNLDINSNTIFCKNNYFNISNLKVYDNIDLNCNNSNLIGNSKDIAINILGSTNTRITNCNFINYSRGVSYSYARVPNGYIMKHKESRNNKILNSSFNNIRIAIITKFKSSVENIHNNLFSNVIYSIYNSNLISINASNNYFYLNNSNNISKIPLSFKNPKVINYKPYYIINNKSILNNSSLIDNKIDFFINKTSIVLRNNSNTLSFYLNKNYITFDPKPETKIEILIVFKNETNIIFNKTIFVDEFKPKSKLINVNLNISKNYSQLNLYLDPNNLFNGNENHLNNIIELNSYRTSSLYYSNINNYSLNSIIVQVLNKSLHLNIIKTKNNSSIYNNILFKPKIQINFKLNENLISEKDCNYFINYTNNKDLKLISIEYMSNYDLPYILNDLKKNWIIYLNLNSHKSHNISNNMSNNSSYLIHIINNSRFKKKEIKFKINFDGIWKDYNYSIIKFEPNNKKNYYPIVFAGGLWSNISSWEVYAKELADNGYETYLIELTGSKEIDSNLFPYSIKPEFGVDNYDYTYGDLIKIIFPKYLDKIIEDSDSSKLIYIGHSNGARVSLDSLENGYYNSSKIDTLISIGIPGSFKKQSIFTKIIKDYGDDVINLSIRYNKSHIALNNVINDVLLNFKFNDELNPYFNEFNSKNKISLNLFNQYYYWISSNEDEEPGKNLSIDNYLIIGGNIIYSDLIVPIVDIRNIEGNIISKNKSKIELRGVMHMGMTSNKKVLKEISKYLNIKLK